MDANRRPRAVISEAVADLAAAAGCSISRTAQSDPVGGSHRPRDSVSAIDHDSAASRLGGLACSALAVTAGRAGSDPFCPVADLVGAFVVVSAVSGVDGGLVDSSGLVI